MKRRGEGERKGKDIREITNREGQKKKIKMRDCSLRKRNY